MKKLIKSPFLWIGIACILLAFIMPFLGMGGHFKSKFATNCETFSNKPSNWTMNKVVAPEDREDLLETISMEKMKKVAEESKTKLFVGETVYDEAGDTGFVDTIIISSNDTEHELEYVQMPFKMIKRRIYMNFR